MTTEEIEFEINEVFPEDHKHSFLGYEKNEEETSLIED